MDLWVRGVDDEQDNFGRQIRVHFSVFCVFLITDKTIMSLTYLLNLCPKPRGPKFKAKFSAQESKFKLRRRSQTFQFGSGTQKHLPWNGGRGSSPRPTQNARLGSPRGSFCARTSERGKNKRKFAQSSEGRSSEGRLFFGCGFLSFFFICWLLC